MKFSKKYKTILLKGVLPAFLILAFVFGLTVKQTAHALSDRGKKAIGILVGAAATGGIAGAAGGAKWVPLGLFGGGLTGGLIARSSTRNSYEKLENKKAMLEQQLKKTTSASKKERLERKLRNVNNKLNEMGPQ